MTIVNLTCMDKNNVQQTIPVEKEDIELSSLIKGMLDDDDQEEEQTIPITQYPYETLQIIATFCKEYRKNPYEEISKPIKSNKMEDIVVPNDFYIDFLKQFDTEHVLLFNVILCANYLDIKPLLDLTCCLIASRIKDKTPEEIEVMEFIKANKKTTPATPASTSDIKVQ